MAIYGLTGGIGSGKTTVAHIFEHLGIPIYYSDDRAKLLLDIDEELKSDIAEHFNLNLLQDGTLDKKTLASIVFSDSEALAFLNHLIHPRVADDFFLWVEENREAAYLLKEAAILYESGAYKSVDEVIVVTAPKEMRIRRVIKRDGIGREEVLNRMANQWTEEEKIKLADHVIINDLEHSLVLQVLSLHRQFSI